MKSKLFGCTTTVDNAASVDSYTLVHEDNSVEKVIHKLSTSNPYVDKSDRLGIGSFRKAMWISQFSAFFGFFLLWKTLFTGAILTPLYSDRNQAQRAATMGNETPREELIRIWNKALDHIEQNLKNPRAFEAYFDQTKLMSLADAIATITAGSGVAARVLSGNTLFVNLTVDALKAVTQTEYSLRFIDENSYRKKVASETSVSGEKNNRFFATSRLNKDYNFDTFVKGSSNMDAYRAAVLAVTSPGSMNPIFLYSDKPGYGKTHLLNAIGNAYVNKYPGRKVLYTNTEQFVDEFITFTQGRYDQEEFQSFFRNIDILLIDDIQLLRGKTKTLAFFFNLFNAMTQSHKQIVMTSDRSPSELDGLEDRLVSRFSSGLSITIKKPEPDTMLDILKVKIASLHLDVSLFAPETLQYLVNHNPGNIRAMEGDLKKLLFISTSHQNTGKVNLEFCHQAFADRKGRGGSEKDPLNPGKIIAAVCGYYNVTETQVRSKVRTLQIAMARQISMYLCRSLLDMSFQDIGKEFGRDHSTVMTAVKKVAGQNRSDRALQASLVEIGKKLAPQGVGKVASTVENSGRAVDRM